jgi:hypothetical protein
MRIGSHALQDKTMKRKVALTRASLLFFILATLAACGGNSDSGSSSAPPPDHSTTAPPPDNSTGAQRPSSVAGFVYVPNNVSDSVSAYTMPSMLQLGRLRISARPQLLLNPIT